MPYSSKDDLLVGDIPLPARWGDGSSMVQLAADEIDSQIGHIYITPITLDPNDPAVRPSRLLLKNINNFIASGRLLMDMGAGAEDTETQAYGRSLLNEGRALLAQISKGLIKLTADLLPTTASEDTAPLVHNEDNESMVEAFYARAGGLRPLDAFGLPQPVVPYGNNPL